MPASRAGRLAVSAVFALLAIAPAWSRAETPSALRSAEAQETFLLKADVVAAKELGKGVTKPWRLTLRDGGLTHDAAFQDIDAKKEEARFRSGKTERNFRDYYGYNIAAYRLARLLGYDDLVPVTIERNWKNRRGAVSWWVDKKWDEDERVKAGAEPTDIAAWERQLYLARAFTALVDDTDRNLGNQLVTADFHLWLIDFTRAFRHNPALKNPALLRRIDRRFYNRLKTLRAEDLAAAVSHWVDGPARKALLARRDAMVAHFDALSAARDPASVFYDTDPIPVRPQEHP